METDHWDSEKIEQNEWGFCDRPILFYTDGLGPCIGICIAWKCWAAILHSSNPIMDEMDLFKPMIDEAKRVIPRHLHPSIHPVVCGGDLIDPYDSAADADFGPDEIRQCREKALELLSQSGFGDPHVKWNPAGVTSSVVADLKASTVYVEHDDDKVGKWAIHQDG